MAKKRKKVKKGHARRGKLRRRYGRSFDASTGQIRVHVSGELLLDPTQLEEAVETAVEEAAVEVLPEVAAEAAVEAVAETAESLA
jgi:hypothetical protein